jgi:hypothetical protein
MTSPVPRLLIDTCSIINLSYCAPVGSIFRSRYEGVAGWVRATQAELVRQRSRRPPHPQAGRAGNWAASWLGMPIEILDENLLVATEASSASSPLVTPTPHLTTWGKQRASRCSSRSGKDGSSAMITRPEPRHGSEGSRRVPRSAIAQLLTVAGSGVDPTMADTYLQTLRARGRMHAQLTSIDLLAGDLGPWQ